MTKVKQYIQSAELTALNASILAYRDTLRVAEQARAVLATEHQRLLAKWEPELERLKAKDDAARERAEERDRDYPQDHALDDLEALVDEMNEINPDDTDSALFAPLAIPGAGF